MLGGGQARPPWAHSPQSATTSTAMMVNDHGEAGMRNIWSVVADVIVTSQVVGTAGILTPVLTSCRPFHAARPGEASCQRYEAGQAVCLQAEVMR